MSDQFGCNSNLVVGCNDLFIICLIATAHGYAACLNLAALKSLGEHCICMFKISAAWLCLMKPLFGMVMFDEASVMLSCSLCLD
jgi:hypothetical protein